MICSLGGQANFDILIKVVNLYSKVTPCLFIINKYFVGRYCRTRYCEIIIHIFDLLVWMHSFLRCQWMKANFTIIYADAQIVPGWQFPSWHPCPLHMSPLLFKYFSFCMTWLCYRFILDFSCLGPEISTSPRGTFGREWYLETKIQVLNVLIALGMLLL